MRVLLGVLTFCFGMQLNAQSVTDIWSKMSNAMQNVRTVSYVMTSKERFKGKYIQKKVKFRIQRTPQKVYGKNMGNGVEFLYVNGWNNNKAYVNPNGFPYVNLSLNILGSRIRNENHHTINHTGFGYMHKLLKSVEKKIKRSGKSLSSAVRYKGTLEWNGQKCYKLEYYDGSYRQTSFKCTQSESLYALCNRKNWPEYAVMEANRLGFGAKVSAGKVLKVPSNLAKKIILYVSASNYLPVVQIMYDDQGLYERYEYRNVKLNPSLFKGEWTSNCSAYGF